MNRSPVFTKLLLSVSSVLVAQSAHADPVLNNNAAHMTATNLSRSAKQDVLPLWWNRGTDLEGGIRFGGDVPASPGFNSGMGAATMGGIELASLGFSMSEVDMALPTNGPSVVIGRSFNHRHEDDAKVSWSNGLQGYNWFQSAMPEIVVYAGGGANDDIVYLVYGANRFMEFKETSTTGKFKGMNGTTGVVIFTAGNGSTTYDTYNRLLANVLYPAQGYAGETTADRTVAFAYNAQGQKKYQLDNNGTAMEYSYDTAGRKTDEAVLSSSLIDTSVLRVATAYNSRGLVETVTQFDANHGGDETDQVLYRYDDWGNLTDFRQDYDDIVTDTSPNDCTVTYTYTKVDTTSPTSGTRRSGLRRTTAGIYSGAGATGAGTKKYETTAYFANSEGGDTLFDDDHGRVTYVRRTYPTASLDLEVYRYGGAATKVVGYLPESAVQSRAAWPTTSGWDLGFDRFGRPIRTYIYKNGAGTYVDLRVSHDDNSNISAVENAWVTPWSATYESDGLNRLKGAKQGVMTSGSISTIVQQEDWQTAGGSLKLDQVGNWIDYTRKRETVTQDEWAGNTFSGINTYTKIDKVSGADWLPEYNPKGLSKKDDSSGGSTKGYQYTYDAWDRLVRVTLTAAGGSGEVAAYRYNGLGHRIARAWDDNKDSVVDSSDTWHHLQTNERWQEVAVWKAGDTDVMEVFTYGQAGMDGYGGSSYIDDIICRERDITTNGSFDDRYYYLQNWRHDVVAIMTYDGAVKERVMYDAYGRPHSFSPGDLKGGGGSSNERPDGILNSTDTWATGSVAWNRDLGNSSGVAIPDGVVDANDGTTLTSLKAAGYSGGWGLLSSSAVGNRKGYAGYEFDPVLNGAAGGDEKPVYHVRHRVLASDTGKWLQKDPLGYHDGMDLYEYCQSDAIDGLDAMGLAVGARTCIRAEPVLQDGPNHDSGDHGPFYRYEWTADATDKSIVIKARATYSLAYSPYQIVRSIFTDVGAKITWSCNMRCEQVVDTPEWEGNWRIVATPSTMNEHDSSWALAASVSLTPNPNPSTWDHVGYPLSDPPRFKLMPSLAFNWFGGTRAGIRATTPGGKSIGGVEGGIEVSGEGHLFGTPKPRTWQCCCTQTRDTNGTIRSDDQCARIRRDRLSREWLERGATGPLLP